eukprot:2511486-Rhodomonas_salina.4
MRQSVADSYLSQACSGLPELVFAPAHHLPLCARRWRDCLPPIWPATCTPSTAMRTVIFQWFGQRCVAHV